MIPRREEGRSGGRLRWGGRGGVGGVWSASLSGRTIFYAPSHYFWGRGEEEEEEEGVRGVPDLWSPFSGSNPAEKWAALRRPCVYNGVDRRRLINEFGQLRIGTMGFRYARGGRFITAEAAAAAGGQVEVSGGG